MFLTKLRLGFLKFFYFENWNFNIFLALLDCVSRAYNKWLCPSFAHVAITRYLMHGFLSNFCCCFSFVMYAQTLFEFLKINVFWFFSSAWLCHQSSWNRNSSFVRRCPSSSTVRVAIISVPNTRISFNFWLLLPLGHTFGRYLNFSFF